MARPPFHTAFALFLSPLSAPAQTEPARAELPITRLVLYSSGVGYYLREGTVNGTARVDLQFPESSVNDLLKSLVLSDKQGKVSLVSYDGRNPLERMLKSFAVDLTDNPSVGQLLAQVRGERVEVIDRQGGAAVTGSIVSLVREKTGADKGPAEVEVLNLLTADGLQSLPMAQVKRVRFLKAEIEAEFRKALEALAAGRDQQKKSVSLQFTGTGPRTVHVGYLTECPLWKTTYRLSLEADGKAFLQGWAIVENTTDEDWSRVRLGLVSGRPISYRMNLYDPLFVPRPLVEPEVFASLRPPNYQGDMGGRTGRPLLTSGASDAEGDAVKKPGEQKQPELAKDLTAMLRVAPRPILRAKEMPAPNFSSPVAAGEGVVSAAAGVNLGDTFEYAIAEPVSLPRQKSALIPIVNEPVEGKRVSIYNPAVHAKHPLLGVRFTNATALHLMQGPITVIDGPNYAGDGRLPDLKPKQDQLIAYAIDLGTEVDPGQAATADNYQTVKVVKGVLTATNRQRQTRTYRVLNRGETARTVLIEHPVTTDWKLVAPAKPAEQARDVYRFEVTAEPNKPVTLEVVEERDASQFVTFDDEEKVRFFLKATVAGPKVKEALAKALDLKGAQATTKREIEKEETALKEIEADQTRMRANLAQVPAMSDLHQRYLKKMDEQETEIEKRRARLKELQATAEKQRAAYEDFVQWLTVE